MQAAVLVAAGAILLIIGIIVGVKTVSQNFGNVNKGERDPRLTALVHDLTAEVAQLVILRLQNPPRNKKKGKKRKK